MNEKKIIVVMVGIFVVVLGGIWYLFFQGKGENLVASGTIEAKEIVVSSKVMGKVMEVKVEEGEKVEMGQVLAVIDPREAQVAFKSAQANFSIAESEFKRSSELFLEGVITKQQYDRAKSNYEMALASLENAKIYLENTKITAPISGVVLVKAIERGELASIGTPIVTLADLNDLELMVYLAEKDVGKVRLGQEVLISVDAYPQEKFKGKVVFISDRAEFTPKVIQTKEERTTQVFGIKIKIPNPDLKLKPGIPADAEFIWNTQ